jgi:hypothetical protein
MQVTELTAVRQTLQADLETSIRRIVDLQAALEEVESSDDSDSERYLLTRRVGSPVECLQPRRLHWPIHTCDAHLCTHCVL